ncbi:hypothetical protein [Fredinandcohnia quinoae]|uniref:Uncharacterized protein n=1 Tax=Fredinandcohnia quinoae TaxID=2918902 RepID=A0AAW5E3R6_9BACI|nr:hypothetical protein [Fredinandcohnia sp. SECRCQ15]MCH1624636.1 hypothetical protein [Fredinandcohnia sp. SECRCQ15]
MMGSSFQLNRKVHPKTVGISVSPSTQDLPTHLKYPEFGGTGKDPIWKMNANNLGSDLVHVPDKLGHGTIQAARSMSFEDYQKSFSRNTN